MPVPTLAVAKFAAPELQKTLPASTGSTPASEQLVIVAVVVLSYTLLLAVTLAVTTGGVILALVVAVVDVSM